MVGGRRTVPLIWYVLLAACLNVAIATWQAPDLVPAASGIASSLLWTFGCLVALGIVALLALDRTVGHPHFVPEAVGGGLVAMAGLQPLGRGYLMAGAASLAGATVGLLVWALLRRGVDPARPARSAQGRTPALASWAVVLCLATTLVAVARDRSGSPALPPRAVAKPDDPPIILVVVDTLRADRLHRVGPDGQPLMPHSAAFAATATNYSQARSPASWTRPAMATLHTGVPPEGHEVVPMDAVIPRQLSTVAELLRTRAGYRTGAVVQNPQLSAAAGFSRGFEEWIAFPRLSRPGESLGDRVRRLISPTRYASNQELTDLACQRLLAWIEEPFLLWVHYFDPHVPYAPPADILARWSSESSVTAFAGQEAIRAGRHVDPTERQAIELLYDAEVRDVDREIGRLFDLMKRLGIWDRSLIILTADHGEEFWEHGAFEHGHSVYDELLRVPLLVKLPGQRHGRVVSGLVSTLRVPATVLAAAGLRAPWPARLLDGAPGADDVVVSYSHLYGPSLRATIQGGTKLIEDLGGEAPPLLIDLAVDPGERYARVALDDPGVQPLMAQQTAYLEIALGMRQQLGLDNDRVQLPAALLQELRTHGYVQ